MDIAYRERRQLGVPFGESREGAFAAYETAIKNAQALEGLIDQYPQVAKTRWPDLQPAVQKLRYDLEDTLRKVKDMTGLFTRWGVWRLAAENNNATITRWAELFKNMVLDSNVAAPDTTNANLPGGGIPGLPGAGGGTDSDDTMLYVGVGVAVVSVIGLAIYLNRPKTAVAGLRRRRR